MEWWSHRWHTIFSHIERNLYGYFFECLWMCRNIYSCYYCKCLASGFNKSKQHRNLFRPSSNINRRRSTHLCLVTGNFKCPTFYAVFYPNLYCYRNECQGLFRHQQYYSCSNDLYRYSNCYRKCKYLDLSEPL